MKNNVPSKLVSLLLLGAAWLGGVGNAADGVTASNGDGSFDEMKLRSSERRGALGEMARRLLEERYDLSDRPAADALMSGGKPVQDGVRARLMPGIGWKALLLMTPGQMRESGIFPAGFMPLPHPNHPEGGMIFPAAQIAAIKRQDGRDLERFDLDFDIPERFQPEFPPGMYLTTRPDLGDVSKGKLVTIDNYYELMQDILNPKQLDGLRLLLTPFPQQQFNATDDRRVARPSLGVSCFDCHANGGTNAATHLVGDVRPQAFRHRIDTPSLRGVNIQRLFGSQRALKTIEDFTEFEQRAAYFDADTALAAKKGVNVLDRATQVHAMSEFMALLNFPPASKLGVDGKLDAKKASAAEVRGQALFFGKAACVTCHAPPYYTDNTMHDLQVERFYKPRMINGMMASADGPIKTFPLRGIKDTPPYLHDGRLLTLADSVRFFNLVLETKLTEKEEADLVSFMKAL